MTNLENVMATRVKTKWPYRANLNKPIANDEKTEIDHWCRNNIKNSWTVTCVADLVYYQFSEEKDAIMFTLRWGVM